MIKQEIRCGCRDGVPIALGYFSVSFSFGIMAMSGGLSGFQAALMSLTNMTSAGQFAGLQVIIAGGTLLEMAATQLIINLRYALMSLSLSQKLAGKVTMRQRFVIAFANTDEIFAVAMSHGKELSFPYIVGLQVLPILGWTAGTACGAATVRAFHQVGLFGSMTYHFPAAALLVFAAALFAVHGAFSLFAVRFLQSRSLVERIKAME